MFETSYSSQSTVYTVGSGFGLFVLFPYWEFLSFESFVYQDHKVLPQCVSLSICYDNQ